MDDSENYGEHRTCMWQLTVMESQHNRWCVWSQVLEKLGVESFERTSRNEPLRLACSITFFLQNVVFCWLSLQFTAHHSFTSGVSHFGSFRSTLTVSFLQVGSPRSPPCCMWFSHYITVYIHARYWSFKCQQGCVKGQILQACRGHSVAECG